MWLGKQKSITLVAEADALPGREQAILNPGQHLVLGRSMSEVPEGYRQILLAMGCFWGAERRFWQQDGVFSTAAGYAGGFTPNPNYEEVCSGFTGHTEVVRVVYEDVPNVLNTLLKVFWESHDPTQGMRQGNDMGTQYRSAIYCYAEDQLAAAKDSAQMYQEALSAQGYGEITTEIRAEIEFFFAEDYHQQYLYKNPQGYCGLRGTGASLS